jgi:hypothetical protein
MFVMTRDFAGMGGEIKSGGSERGSHNNRCHRPA